MAWSRRDVLRALGGAALAPAVAPFVSACRTPDPGRDGGPRQPRRATDELRAQLRGVIADLSQRFPYASALAVIQRTGLAAVDPGDQSLSRQLSTALVVTVGTATSRFEHVTRDLSARGVDRADRELRALASAGFQSSRSPRELGAPRHFEARPAADPRRLSDRDWLDRLEAVHACARGVGGSRVVYRGAYLLCDDIETLYLGEGRDLSQRIVRTRCGVVMIAQSRAGAVVEVAENSGAGGLELAAFASGDRCAAAVESGARAGAPGATPGATPGTPGSQAAAPAQGQRDESAGFSVELLERSADRALSLLTPGALPAGERDVVLSGEVAAWLIHGCVIPALTGDRWLSSESAAAALVGQRVGSELVTIRDDPALAGAYGSYAFDDEGALTAPPGASPVVAIEGGALVRPLTDRVTAERLSVPRSPNARRVADLSALAPRPSNTIASPGDATREDMVADVRDGLLLEAPLAVRVDLATWRFVVRVARAHEIAGGKLTGVLRGITELSGRIPDVLGAVRAASRTTTRLALGVRDSDGSIYASHASASAPDLLTRGHLVGV